jgi:hypothetical protein
MKINNPYDCICFTIRGTDNRGTEIIHGFFYSPLPSPPHDLTPRAHILFIFFIYPYCSNGSYRWLRALTRAYDNRTRKEKKTDFDGESGKGCYEVDIRPTSNLWLPNPRENVKLAHTLPSKKIADFLLLPPRGSPPRRHATAPLPLAHMVYRIGSTQKPAVDSNAATVCLYSYSRCDISFSRRLDHARNVCIFPHVITVYSHDRLRDFHTHSARPAHYAWTLPSITTCENRIEKLLKHSIFKLRVRINNKSHLKDLTISVGSKKMTTYDSYHPCSHEIKMYSSIFYRFERILLHYNNNNQHELKFYINNIAHRNHFNLNTVKKNS